MNKASTEGKQRLTCRQGGPSLDPSLTPSQDFFGTGGLNLKSPVGGSAKGIPAYE